MALTVKVEFSPIYELIASLAAYSNPKLDRSLDLDRRWWAQVRRTIPPLSLKGESLREATSHTSAVLLVRASALNGHSPITFTKWLRNQTSASLRSIMEPYFIGLPWKTEVALINYRNSLAELVDFWSEHYMPTLNPDLLTGLERQAKMGQELAARLPPSDVIEQLTGGIHLQECPEERLVLLIPQYHGRPINFYEHRQGLSLYLYPADALPPDPGQVPRELLRVTAALSDSSRLKMLRLLSDGAISFSDLVSQTALAKSTVHHHLVILRAAGLLRIHDRLDSGALFELRPTVGDLVKNRLMSYLRGEPT